MSETITNTDDIVRAAIKGEIIKEFASPAEKALYYHIQVINLKLQHNDIIAPMATAEKLDALREYSADKVECENGKSALQRLGKLFKDLELASTAFRVNRTLENADKLLFAVDGGVLRKVK